MPARLIVVPPVGCLVTSWGCFVASMSWLHRAFRRATKAAKSLIKRADRLSLEHKRGEKAQKEMEAAAAVRMSSAGGGGQLISSPGARLPSASSGPRRSPLVSRNDDDSGEESGDASGDGEDDEEHLSDVEIEVGGMDSVRESAHLAMQMIDHAHLLTVVRRSVRSRATHHYAPSNPAAQCLPLARLRCVTAWTQCDLKL